MDRPVGIWVIRTLTLPAAAPLVSVTTTRNEDVVFCACTDAADRTNIKVATTTENDLMLSEVFTSLPPRILVIRGKSIAQRPSLGMAVCCRLRIGYEFDKMAAYGLQRVPPKCASKSKNSQFIRHLQVGA